MRFVSPAHLPYKLGLTQTLHTESFPSHYTVNPVTPGRHGAEQEVLTAPR